MKSKLLFLLFSVTLIFSGCTTMDNPIEEIDFNVEFEQLNLEENTATFIVEGYPNETEFKQLSEVIVDSLDAQNTKDSINVSVYSNFQDEIKEEPFYGTAVYQGGKITEDNLNVQTEDAFLEMV